MSSIAIAAVIISTFFLYKNQIQSDRILDIEDRLKKLENKIYKPEPDNLEPSHETKYIDSNISNIQKDKTNAL